MTVSKELGAVVGTPKDVKMCSLHRAVWKSTTGLCGTCVCKRRVKVVREALCGNLMEVDARTERVQDSETIHCLTRQNTEQNMRQIPSKYKDSEMNDDGLATDRTVPRCAQRAQNDPKRVVRKSTEENSTWRVRPSKPQHRG